MSESSPFLLLDEDTFEDLCCDLLAAEEGISYAERFGVRGQRQDGIDIRAYRCGSTDTEVGQSKRCAVFKKPDLEEAMRKFQEARSVWETWNVRRFVLFVASSVRDRKVQDEFQAQREAWAKEHVAFELWGDETLFRKLRNQRAIAARYFSGETLRHLCGSTFTYGASPASVLDATAGQLAFVEECSAEFLGEAETELREIRETARAGQPLAAAYRVQQLVSSPRWSLLPGRTRARALRLAASLALDCERDADRADGYLADARSLDARENYQVIESAIALHRSDAATALGILGEPRDVDAFNIQLALWIQTGRSDEVLKAIEQARFEVSLRSLPF